MDIHAGCARLNLHYCAICGSSKNGQYFQVDLRQDHTIIGVATQGFQALITYFVRSYNLTHSRDGQTWSIFPEVLTGNHDGTSVVKHIFSSPMCARYIRLYPTGYSHGGFCVRMELYGCSNCSSLLSTTSSPTTQHSENNTTKNNRTTAASSTEMPLIIHSASASSALSTMSSPATQHDQSVGSSKVLRTTQGREKTLPTESQTLNITTQMNRDNSREGFSKTLMIALVVVAIIIIIICLLVAWLCRRRRKGIYHCNPRNGMQSKETVEINERTERDCIASGSDPEVTVSAV